MDQPEEGAGEYLNAELIWWVTRDNRHQMAMEIGEMLYRSQLFELHGYIEVLMAHQVQHPIPVRGHVIVALRHRARNLLANGEQVRARLITALHHEPQAPMDLYRYLQAQLFNKMEDELLDPIHFGGQGQQQQQWPAQLASACCKVMAVLLMQRKGPRQPSKGKM